MKKLLLSLFTAIIICIASVSAYAESSGYIVRFKDECEIENSGITLMSNNALASEEIEPVIPEWNMYTVSEADINKLDMSKVEYIAPNYTIYLMDNYPNDPYFYPTISDTANRFYIMHQRYLHLINIQYAWQNNFFGENVKVAVIDSGIDTEHPDLKDNIGGAYDYCGSGIVEEADANQFTSEEIEKNGILHGSTIAGIISAGFNNSEGIAGMTKAKIYSYKAFKLVKDANNTVSQSANTDDVIKAMKDAVDKQKCDIINLSLGFINEDTPIGGEIPAEALKPFTDVIDYATDNNVIIVAASGNYGNATSPKNPIVYPAYCDNVIAVGALGKSPYKSEDSLFYLNESDMKVRANYSTYNKMTDVCVPGTYLLVARGNYTPTGGTRDAADDYWFNSGTSYAAPQIAAAAAIVKGIDKRYNHDYMEFLLKYSCDDLGEAGRDDEYGWGMLNIQKMVDIAKNKNYEHIGSYEPKYNSDKKELSIEYFNPNTENSFSASLAAAIYDSSGFLVNVTTPQDITLAPLKKQAVTINDVVIPEGGSVKVICVNNWHDIKPVTDIESLSIA